MLKWDVCKKSVDFVPNLRGEKSEGYKVRGKGWTEQELKDAISDILTEIERLEKTIEELKEDEEKGIQRYSADNASAIRGFYALCYKSREGLIHTLYSLGEDINNLIPHFNLIK